MALLNLITPYSLKRIKHKMVNAPPWDRLVNSVEPGVFDPLKYTLILPKFDDILKHKPVTETFKQLCEKRSEELKNLNAPIFLFYSGGIDSSVIMQTLFETWSPSELERVSIVTLSTSVVENKDAWPKIHNTFKNRIYNAMDIDLEDHILKTPNAIVVNGELGDQLFGADTIFEVERHFDFDTLFKPWEEVIPFLYYQILNKDRNIKWQKMNAIDIRDLISNIARTTKKCPFKIKTTFDFLWWFNYTNKAQSVYLRFMTTYPKLNSMYKENRVNPFFYTMDFFRWSIDNHENGIKIKNTMETYKFAAKKYLYEITNDYHYYINKRKIGSLGNILNHQDVDRNTFVGVDENFEYLNLEEVLNYVH